MSSALSLWQAARRATLAARAALVRAGDAHRDARDALERAEDAEAKAMRLLEQDVANQDDADAAAASRSEETENQ